MSVPFANLVVRASAGSGKTFKLSERYLRLLLEGEQVDSILATTFTRKAAGEIQDRILSRLGNGALSPEGARKLSAELFGGDADRISQERLQLLARDVVRSLNKLRICTLDAFFMQIAGGFAFEIGLPANWTIVEEVENVRLLHRAIQSSFAQSQTKNVVQLARLLFKGDLNRTIERQISDLVTDAFKIYYESKPDDWSRLDELLTYTPGELETLKDSCVQGLQNAPLPFNKDGKTVKKRYSEAVKKLLGLIEAQKWNDVLGETIVKKVVSGEMKYDSVEIEEELAEPIRKLVQYNLQKTLSNVSKQTRATWATLDAISRSFERLKRERGAFRFEDLSRILVRLETAKKLKQIVYRLDARTSHLLLDEFQDVSFEQWSIVKPFAESIVSAKSIDEPDRLNSFFCVGDVKQAIYGWRGGVAEIFSAIERDLPNIQTEEMACNWRSCPTIIDVVNQLFASLSENPAFQSGSDVEDDPSLPIREAVLGWQTRFPQHHVAEKNLNKLGYWSLEAAPRVDKDGRVPDISLPPINLTKGEPVDPMENGEAYEYEKLDDASDDSDEFDDFDEEQSATSEDRTPSKLQKQATLKYIVERIVQLRRRYPNASIGVLPRTNKRIAQIIAKLKERGVEASEEGGAPLVDAPSVNAILSVLTFASHPGDSVARFHIANVAPLSKRFNITLENYDQMSRSRAAAFYIRSLVETRGLGRFVAELRDLLTPICPDDRNKERLDKFVEFAFSYQQSTPQVRLDQFVQATRELRVESPSSTKLRVMSLHKSKGLEFDIVVLPELDAPFDKLRQDFFVRRTTPTSPIDAVVKKMGKVVQDTLPDDFRKIFVDALRSQVEEALCLLYVALTRPVRMLVAIVPPVKKKGGKNSFSEILRCGLAPNVVPPDENSPLFSRAQILFESGDPDWNRDENTPDVLVERATFQSLRQSPITRPLSNEGDDSTFPTRRLLFHRETPTGEREARRWSRASSFRQGTALHACFESIRWLDVDGCPSDDQIRDVIFPILQDPDEVRVVLKRFHAIIDSPFTRSLLSLSTYRSYDPTFVERFGGGISAATYMERYADPNWVVYRERPFSQSASGDRLWRGTIDRLVLLRDGDRVVGADVVDFKTDRFVRPSGANETGTEGEPSILVEPPEETMEEYRRQLAYYGSVVSQWYSLPPEKVSLRLAFVAEGYARDAR